MGIGFLYKQRRQQITVGCFPIILGYIVFIPIGSNMSNIYPQQNSKASKVLLPENYRKFTNVTKLI